MARRVAAEALQNGPGIRSRPVRGASDGQNKGRTAHRDERHPSQEWSFHELQVRPSLKQAHFLELESKSNDPCKPTRRAMATASNAVVNSQGLHTGVVARAVQSDRATPKHHSAALRFLGAIKRRRTASASPCGGLRDGCHQGAAGPPSRCRTEQRGCLAQQRGRAAAPSDCEEPQRS